jgi:maltose phosphorylase
LGYEDLAYKFYLRTARLDLDDYNHDANDGLHITSMAGTWMSIVEGFGGARVSKGVLQLSPALPKQWQSYSFKITFRGALLKISVKQEELVISNESATSISLVVYGVERNIAGNDVAVIKR